MHRHLAGEGVRLWFPGMCFGLLLLLLLLLLLQLPQLLLLLLMFLLLLMPLHRLRSAVGGLTAKPALLWHSHSQCGLQ